MGKFVIRPVKTGVKFDLRAANGQTVATSEAYSSPAACRKGIAGVVRSAPSAPVIDQTLPDIPSAPRPRFELYRDRSGSYRFRLVARNGRIIAVSEGYSSKAGCLEGIESVRKNASSPEILLPPPD